MLIRLPSVLYGVWALAAALFWGAFAADRILYARWGAELRTGVRPLLLNGLVLPLDRFLEPRFQPRGGRYLVFVSSDTCPYSLAEVERWTALVRSVPFEGSDTVLLLDMSARTGSGELRQAVEDVGLAYQDLTVSDRTGFMKETGIGWTPHTLVLDESCHVRLTSETVTPVVHNEIVRWFGSGTRKE